MMARLQPWTGLMPTLALSVFLTVAQNSGLLWAAAEERVSSDIVKKESHPVLVRQKREWIWNTFTVEEEKPGPFPQKITQLKSTLRESVMKFKIDGEGANTIFFVDANGNLFARKALDREEKANYSLTAQMFDGNGRLIEDSGDFVIQVNDINDNKPVFPKQYTGSILERASKGTKVIDAVATDADDPSTANGLLFYSLIHGGDTFAFEIDSSTGAISCKTNTLDRETKSQYVVVVQAQDMGGRDTGSTATTSVIINITDINDNLASFTSNAYEVRVPENHLLNEEIITLDLNDKDELKNKEPIFSIPSFHKDLFNVKRNRNKDAVLTLKQALDYETTKSYTFTVEVKEDLGLLRADNVGKAITRAQVILRVTDVDEPPVFSRSNYTFTVPEDKEIKTAIGAVTAKDPDAANKAVRYSILEKDCPIGINPVTGQLSIARKLDRELEATHVFQVRAQEELSGLESYVKVKIIVQDVNDNPPELSVDEVFVCENDVTNTVIGVLRATDKDEQAATFTFTLIGQSSNFSIKDYGNGSAGVIVKGGPFSIDDSQDYGISVRISDGGQPAQSNDAELKIKSCRCDRQRIPTQCKAMAQRMGVSVHALIAILLCILTILVIVILFVMRKRYQKDSLANMKNSGEIHEQLVTYDEEGGGEMDTNGYDVSILTSACHDGSLLRHPDHPHPSLYAMVQKPPQHAQPTACKGDMAAMIEVKKDEADHDRDGFPYDTLHIYGYEGPESLAGSLSSLESSSTGSNLDYDFLSDWGPRFRALAELYGVDGSDYYQQY
ncbi:cadherin-5 [Cololabis saira]|uniref:cadherin-5 n=1 Tax=Cololabis saira TaxID=129043 RepID=UPI002AD3AA75|nr:cadherin-5 [Cololabis saira]XP_061601236.1 cadherin-5 [Cololabis saira]